MASFNLSQLLQSPPVTGPMWGPEPTGPLSPQQRASMITAIRNPSSSGGGLNILGAVPESYFNGLSDADLWSQYVTAVQHSSNPADDSLNFVAPGLIGLAGGALMGGAGAGEVGMSTADAATLGSMTEGVGAGAAGAGATGAGAAGAAGSAGGYAMPAAVPESASTLADWGMTETSPGVWTQTASAAASGGTALSRLLKGDATTEDYLELLGRAAPGLLGAYGANKQANAYSDLGEKYLSIGAPSRARFESSFAPGFSMENEPGFKDALALTTKETLHQLSPGGNPVGSPNAWQQTLKDVNAKFAYPALNEYRRVNAGAGGLAALTSAAPGAESSAINANKGVYDALGAGAADIFSPPKSLSDLLRAIKQAGY